MPRNQAFCARKLGKKGLGPPNVNQTGSLRQESVTFCLFFRHLAYLTSLAFGMGLFLCGLVRDYFDTIMTRLGTRFALASFG
jgi:hypothetical protein